MLTNAPISNRPIEPRRLCARTEGERLIRAGYDPALARYIATLRSGANVERIDRARKEWSA